MKPRPLRRLPQPFDTMPIPLSGMHIGWSLPCSTTDFDKWRHTAHASGRTRKWKGDMIPTGKPSSRREPAQGNRRPGGRALPASPAHMRMMRPSASRWRRTAEGGWRLPQTSIQPEIDVASGADKDKAEGRHTAQDDVFSCAADHAVDARKDEMLKADMATRASIARPTKWAPGNDGTGGTVPRGHRSDHAIPDRSHDGLAFSTGLPGVTGQGLLFQMIDPEGSMAATDPTPSTRPGEPLAAAKRHMAPAPQLMRRHPDRLSLTIGRPWYRGRWRCGRAGRSD